MTAITADLLRRAVGCSQDDATRFAPFLAVTCETYEINTPARLAAFLSQIGHESGGFKFVREIASGAAYEGRADLGNTRPGDGERYRAVRAQPQGEQGIALGTDRQQSPAGRTTAR